MSSICFCWIIKTHNHHKTGPCGSSGCPHTHTHTLKCLQINYRGLWHYSPFMAQYFRACVAVRISCIPGCSVGGCADLCWSVCALWQAAVEDCGAWSGAAGGGRQDGLLHLLPEPHRGWSSHRLPAGEKWRCSITSLLQPLHHYIIVAKRWSCAIWPKYQ